MAGHRPFSEIRDKAGTGPGRDARRDQARTALEGEIAAHQVTLADFRRARGATQQQLAKALHLAQRQVSRVEHRTDVLLST